MLYNILYNNNTNNYGYRDPQIQINRNSQLRMSNNLLGFKLGVPGDRQPRRYPSNMVLLNLRIGAIKSHSVVNLYSCIVSKSRA